MNKNSRALMVSGLALALVTGLLLPVWAQDSSGTKQTKAAVKCSAASMPAQSPDVTSLPPQIAKIKLPVTFVCKHCGIKMTIKATADWLKPCPVCPCATQAWKCYPTKG